jgi:hypothetical protein
MWLTRGPSHVFLEQSPSQFDPLLWLGTGIDYGGIAPKPTFQHRKQNQKQLYIHLFLKPDKQAFTQTRFQGLTPAKPKLQPSQKITSKIEGEDNGFRR